LAGSRCPSAFGIDVLQLDPEFIPARTPGPMGSLDAGDPDAAAALGDTPGPLGIGDYADPAIRSMLVPPLNFHRVVAYQVFEASVLEAHVKRAALRRHPAPVIEETELEEVEGGHKLRKAVARKCRALLKQARADLGKEKAEFLKKAEKERKAEERAMKARGEIPVTKVHSIGISSAYRSFEYDSALWHRYFRDKYYPTTYSERRRLSCWDGGEFGGEAVGVMVKFVARRKAAPGFSNHTNGIAVDFFTVEAGTTLQAQTAGGDKALKKINERWEKSWLYRWLEKHKAEYGIERIDSEAWHWEFRK
jgi:hypothetical protein